MRSWLSRYSDCVTWLLPASGTTSRSCKMSRPLSRGGAACKCEQRREQRGSRLKKSPGFLTGRGLSLTKVRHLKSPASPITPTRNAAFGSGAGLGRRGTNRHNLHLQGACWKCETICQLLVARICHLAYLAIRRREGTDPWSVGTTSARPSGPHARSRTAPFLSYDACAPAYLAAPLTLVLGRSRLAGAYRACRTAIGRTSNKSAAAKLGPVIVLPTASTVCIAEKPSASTDAFQA